MSRHNWKSLQGLVLSLSLSLFLLASSPAAQGPEFTWRAGGIFYDADAGPNHTVSVADGGRIMYYDSTVQAWQQAFTPPDVRGDLHRAFFLDDMFGQTGWAVGAGGTILKTTNGGMDWTRANLTPILDRNIPPMPADLYGIYMFTNEIGWCVGLDGAAWFSSDGWLTWGLPPGGTLPGVFTPDSPGDPDDIYAITFPTPQIGVLAADKDAYVSLDGGLSWAVAPKDVEPCLTATGGSHAYIEFWDVAFSGGEGLMVGGFGVQQGFVYTSADYGQSWTHNPCFDLTFPLVPGTSFVDCTTPTIYGAAIAGSHSVVAGYATLQAVFEPGAADHEQCRCTPTSACSGATSVWVQKNTPSMTSSNVPLQGVEPISPNEVLFAGMFGILQRYNLTTGQTVDEGTVERHRLGGGAFLSGDTGCVIAQGNVILRTTSSGDDWTVVYQPAVDGGNFGQDLAFSSSGLKAVAVGDGSFSAWSIDSGVTWSAPTTSLGNGVQPKAVAFAPGTDVVYAVANSGFVRKSTDGGINWTVMPPPTTETLYGVSFATASVGYAVGANQTALITTDGAGSWTAVDIHGGVPGEDLLAVATWGDGTQAIAVGTDGYVYEKTGARFVKLDLGPLAVSENLTDVQVLFSGPSQHLRICGYNGTVLFRDAGVWSKPKSQTSEALVAVSFLAPDEGYVIGRKILISKYE